MTHSTLISTRVASKTTEQKVVSALLKSGSRNYASIGKDVGLTRERVRQIAKKHDIKRSPSPGPLMVECQHCEKMTPAVPMKRAR